MEWLAHQFKKENGGDKTNGQNPRVSKMYNQYVSLEEIKRKMRVGEVMSGFTFQGNTDKIIIAYGEHIRSGVMKCIGMTRCEKGNSKKVYWARLCPLYSQDIDIKEVESMIEHYCLLLPLIDDGDFENEFPIVYMMIEMWVMSISGNAYLVCVQCALKQTF